MGEYISYSGNQLKLGTCEDLMYVRHDEVEQYVIGARRVEGNLEPRKYLDPQYRWLYRFPFPWEDDEPLGKQREPEGTRIYLDGSRLPVEHQSRWVPVSANHAYNVNISVPCPHTLRDTSIEGGRLFRSSPIPAITPIAPVRERINLDGSLYTVFACGWCDAWFSLPPDELNKVNLEAAPELAERIKPNLALEEVHS